MSSWYLSENTKMHPKYTEDEVEDFFLSVFMHMLIKQMLSWGLMS